MSLRGAGRPGVVSVKESSPRAEPAAPSAASAGSAGRAPDGARPRQRLLLGPPSAPQGPPPPPSLPAGNRAPDPRPRSGTEWLALGTEVSPGSPAAAASRDPVPARPPGSGRDAARPAQLGRWLSPGRAIRSLSRPAPAASRGAGCGPRAAPTRAGRADRTRRSPSCLSRAGTGERAGGREEAPGAAQIRAPRASVWRRRSDVDPPAPDLNRPRSLACPPPRERPLPPAGRTETDALPPPRFCSEPPLPAASRPRSPSGPGAAGPRKPAPLGARWEPDAAVPGAGKLAVVVPGWREPMPGDLAAGLSVRVAATGRADPESAEPGIGRRWPELETAVAPEMREGLPALCPLSTFPCLGRSAPLARTLVINTYCRRGR